MLLSEYLNKTGMPIAELARRSKITANTLHNLIRNREVRSTVLLSIEEGTEGDVTIHELIYEYIKKTEYLKKKYVR